MSKKSPAATAAEPDKPEVQASVPPADPAPAAPADTPPELGAETEQPPAQVRGRALVDLPVHSLKCGEFGTVPAAAVQSLAAAGEFDIKAVEA